MLRAPRSLPASPEREIELDQGGQFITQGLRKGQFGSERIGFVDEHFQIVCCPRFEAHFRQVGGVLREFHKPLMLNPELAIFAISNQRIGHVAESGLNVSVKRNLVPDEEFGLIVGKLVADR